MLLLRNSNEIEGIGKLFVHEKTDNNEELIQTEKFKLISSILISTFPIKIKIIDYHSEIELEYDFLVNKKSKSIDFFNAI